MINETEQEVEISRPRAGVSMIRLNRPDRLNALSHTLLAQLLDTLTEMDEDPAVRAIVLTGTGRAFSSGADLRGKPSDAEDVVRRLYNPLVSAMTTIRTPLVAAVNGLTAGAAVALALACDLRVAAASASFQVSFTKIGLIPDAGLTWLLPRAVGSARAMEMALLASKVDAATALQWGLVNETCPDDSCVDRAIQVAESLAALSSTTGTTRQLMWSSPSTSLSNQLDAEATEQGKAQHGADFVEVRAAFRDGRKPNFGR